MDYMLISLQKINFFHFLSLKVLYLSFLAFKYNFIFTLFYYFFFLLGEIDDDFNLLGDIFFDCITFFVHLGVFYGCFSYFYTF